MPAEKLQVSRRDWIVAVLQNSSALGLIPYLPAATPDWSPSFLSAKQNATLVALGERIIPGTAGALCNRLIDFVLPIESDKNKSELLASLAAFDHEAEHLQQRPFEQLSASQQDELLTTAAQGGKLHAEFSLVKEWMADAYWSSLDGLHELGWTGRMAWESFPNCK
jgi:hypothetical protein